MPIADADRREAANEGLIEQAIPRDGKSVERAKLVGEQPLRQIGGGPGQLRQREGAQVRIDIRPTSVSEVRGNTMTLADPVSRNRPAVLWRSTVSFNADSSSALSGSRQWSAGCLERRRSLWIARAKDNCTGSSRVTYLRPVSVWDSVLLPTWRAPLSKTTGLELSARWRETSKLRLIMGLQHSEGIRDNQPCHGGLSTMAWLIITIASAGLWLRAWR